VIPALVLLPLLLLTPFFLAASVLFHCLQYKPCLH
jgi:hypothetical protein